MAFISKKAEQRIKSTRVRRRGGRMTDKKPVTKKKNYKYLSLRILM